MVTTVYQAYKAHLALCTEYTETLSVLKPVDRKGANVLSRNVNHFKMSYF